MTLSGLFTIINFSSPYYASLEDDSDGACLVGVLSTGITDKQKVRLILAQKHYTDIFTTYLLQWVLLPAEPGDGGGLVEYYKIKNVVHSRYATSSYTQSPSGSVIASDKNSMLQWWTIRKEDSNSHGEDIYRYDIT